MEGREKEEMTEGTGGPPRTVTPRMVDATDGVLANVDPTNFKRAGRAANVAGSGVSGQRSPRMPAANLTRHKELGK